MARFLNLCRHQWRDSVGFPLFLGNRGIHPWPIAEGRRRWRLPRGVYWWCLSLGSRWQYTLHMLRIERIPKRHGSCLSGNHRWGLGRERERRRGQRTFERVFRNVVAHRGLRDAERRMPPTLHFVVVGSEVKALTRPVRQKCPAHSVGSRVEGAGSGNPEAALARPRTPFAMRLFRHDVSSRRGDRSVQLVMGAFPRESPCVAPPNSVVFVAPEQGRHEKEHEIG